MRSSPCLRRRTTSSRSSSSLDAAYSLTTSNASATDYTLTIMTWVAVAFTPIVLMYQGWTYWVFRQRLSVHHIPAAAPEPQDVVA